MTIMRTRRREADHRRGWVRRGRGLGLLAAMLLAAGLTASPAHAVGSSAGGRLLDVTAHDNGPSAAVQRDFYTLNTNQVKAGLVEVRLHNAGTVPHQVQLLRLHDGITLTSFVQAVAASHGAAVPRLSDATGGSNGVDPGGDQTTFVNLRAGNYIALCFLADNGHGAPHFAHGMLSPFTVKGQGDSAHPPGHVFGDIDAFSFGYRMPAAVDGHGFYRFANTAAHDTHELAIVRLLRKRRPPTTWPGSSTVARGGHRSSGPAVGPAHSRRACTHGFNSTWLLVTTLRCASCPTKKAATRHTPPWAWSKASACPGEAPPCLSPGRASRSGGLCSRHPPSCPRVAPCCGWHHRCTNSPGSPAQPAARRRPPPV